GLLLVRTWLVLLRLSDRHLGLLARPGDTPVNGSLRQLLRADHLHRDVLILQRSPSRGAPLTRSGNDQPVTKGFLPRLGEKRINPVFRQIGAWVVKLALNRRQFTGLSILCNQINSVVPASI